MSVQVLNNIHLRAAGIADLPAINDVIEAAIMNWDLPQRVKRLALPSYRYDEHDMDHLHIWVAETGNEIVGVAAVEQADSRELPASKRGLLLHGLYVEPGFQHQGIGSRLMELVEQQVSQQGLDGLLVRAQSGAGDFFATRGMEMLSDDDQRNYQLRFWKQIA